jgi:hypothetical protein
MAAVLLPSGTAAASRTGGVADTSKLTVESLMPSDSVPPPGLADAESSADVESIPPSSRDVESIPPSSRDVESIPPSSRDALTLPPQAGSSVAVESVPSRVHFGVPSERTLVESHPPFDEATMLSPGTTASAVAGSRAPVVTEEPTSAPVVRGVAEPLDEAEAEARSVRGAARQASNRKIVMYVVGGAALLAVIGGLRLIFSGHETPAPGASASAAVTASAAPAAVVPQDEPKVEPTNPPPSSHPTPLPTSAPSPRGAAVGAGPAIDSAPNAKKPVAPRRRYRPTGI